MEQNHNKKLVVLNERVKQVGGTLIIKGEAWAGQAMDSVLSESDKIFSVASEENLGVDPPIGSKVGILRK